MTGKIQKQERYIWMSFSDNSKPASEIFSGVIIVKGNDLHEAFRRINQLGINPGGNILAVKTEGRGVTPDMLDRLLSSDDLEEAGFPVGDWIIDIGEGSDTVH